MNSCISPEKTPGIGESLTTNVFKMGTGRGYAAASNMNMMMMPMGDASGGNTMNQLEMSLESSFFDGSSFIEDGPVGGKACLVNTNQNLEELLQADDVVDPDAFLINPG